MNILDQLLATLPEGTVVEPGDWRAPQRAAHFATLAYRPPVQFSEEIARVAELPRRPQVDLSALSPEAQALVEVMNGRLRRPDWQRTDCKCHEIAPHRAVGGRKACITSLQPAQAWALYEAPIAGGLVGLIATGGGKTGTGILMTTAFNAVPGQSRPVKLAVGIIPSNTVEQFVLEWRLWAEHWRVPSYRIQETKMRGFVFKDGRPILHIVPYSRLHMTENSALLKSLSPDLIYADEMDLLSNLQSARTGRFTRTFAEFPTTRFCGWTGTAWDKTILECTHLADYALKERSPLPRQPHEARQWALALDPSDRPAEPGALMRICRPGEELREGFHKRLVETLGVVATKEGAVQIPHNIRERDPGLIPESVKQALDMVRGFKRPDQEELVDPMEVARVASEVACGFYYRWIFPREERGLDGKLTQRAKDKIDLWFERRRAWRCELRKKLLVREEHLDSEKLCERAAERYWSDYEGELPTWDAENYRPWKEVEDSVYHETAVVWLDDYLALDAARWAKDHLGIVWYKHDAFGQRVAELSGLPLHAGGPDAEAAILAERGDRSIIASINSHGRGRDGLQYLFNRQLITTWPSSGRRVEQLLARLHRQGQPAPTVETELYQHVEELQQAFATAARRARFASETWGASQKILDAESDLLEDEDDD